MKAQDTLTGALKKIEPGEDFFYFWAKWGSFSVRIWVYGPHSTLIYKNTELRDQNAQGEK